jgi:hypothetical protein
MANLISCPTCRREVSEDAEKCPHCGHPIKKKSESGCLVFVGIVMCLAGFFWWPGFIIGILIFIWAAVDKN